MDLKTKLTDMIELVRSNPDNQEHRLALIQYLCLSAKWEQALKQIKTRLVLEEVAKVENITVSDEEIEAEFAKMAESYKMELDNLKSFFGENERKQMYEDLQVQKAVDFLVENAKLV